LIKVVVLFEVVNPETFNDDVNVEFSFNIAKPDTCNDDTLVCSALVRGLFAKYYLSDVSAWNSPTKDEVAALLAALAEFNKITYQFNSSKAMNPQFRGALHNFNTNTCN
jgi:hypothetical protein